MNRKKAEEEPKTIASYLRDAKDSITCMNCGNKIEGRVVDLMKMMPICQECRKTRKVGRGRR